MIRTLVSNGTSRAEDDKITIYLRWGDKVP